MATAGSPDQIARLSDTLTALGQITGALEIDDEVLVHLYFTKLKWYVARLEHSITGTAKNEEDVTAAENELARTLTANCEALRRTIREWAREKGLADMEIMGPIGGLLNVDILVDAGDLVAAVVRFEDVSEEVVRMMSAEG